MLQLYQDGQKFGLKKRFSKGAQTKKDGKILISFTILVKTVGLSLYKMNINFLAL